MPKYDPKSATRQRITRTEAYAERVRRQFAATVNEIIDLKKRMPTEVGQMYSFDGDTNKVQREVERLLRRLHSAVTISIETGITLEWAQANKECDWLVQSCFSKQLLKSPMFAAWADRNDEARRAFIERSERGLNLSDRVWQTCRQLRDEMEMAITVAVGEGEDAGSISRQIRHCLNNPDDMFRRFRYKDEDGNWQRKWKKRVKDEDGTYHWTDYDINDYHTGRGVYRSSAKNAMRVARTETNIAYRRADHERWQKMDFVLGQRVQLSKNHPMHDICDELAGDYPKDFVFDGWHPQCFCFVTPILVDEKEMEKVNEAFLRGEEYTPQGKQITDYPQGFKDFVRDNAHRIEDARLQGKLPYFISNNTDIVDSIIKEDAKNYAPISVKDLDFFVRSGVEFPNKELVYRILPTMTRQGAQQFVSSYVSDFIAHSIDEYAPQFFTRRPELKLLMDEIEKLKGVDERLRIKKINKIKAICAEETVRRLELYSNGFGDRIKFKCTSYNEDIAPPFTFIDKFGNNVTTPKRLYDLVILKDDNGMEFGYPIGVNTATLIINPRNAYNVTRTLPDELRRNVKRINFIKETNPQDMYWKDRYGENHQSMATDGGHVTFWQPAYKISKSDYFYALCHEAAHAYDQRHKNLSEKIEWAEAVQLDIDQTKIVSPYPTHYAETNLTEDFAESVKEWIKNPVWFKECYPNRYRYLINLFNGLLNY